MKKTEEAVSRYNRVVSTTCDICGETTKGDNWGKSGFEKKVSTITYEEGSEYPEGRWGTTYSVDICPECMMNKLVPFLLSLGAKFEETEWEG